MPLVFHTSSNPRMVRGLDYYTGTTFEFVHDLLGAQSGIGGGGRYDGLMEQFRRTVAVRNRFFGLGVDRALLAAEAEGGYWSGSIRYPVFSLFR
jgi:histidyl-tRNA synthetase